MRSGRSCSQQPLTCGFERKWESDGRIPLVFVRMKTTPITDQLRVHLSEHPGDINAIVDALARIEAQTGEHQSNLQDAVPEWPA